MLFGRILQWIQHRSFICVCKVHNRHRDFQVVDRQEQQPVLVEEGAAVGPAHIAEELRLGGEPFGDMAFLVKQLEAMNASVTKQARHGAE